jgi:hypothetical protein
MRFQRAVRGHGEFYFALTRRFDSDVRRSFATAGLIRSHTQQLAVTTVDRIETRSAHTGSG